MVAETAVYSHRPLYRAFCKLIRHTAEYRVPTWEYLLREEDPSGPDDLSLIVYKPTTSGKYVVGLSGRIPVKDARAVTVIGYYVWKLRIDYDDAKLWHVDLQMTAPDQRSTTVKYSFGLASVPDRRGGLRTRRNACAYARYLKMSVGTSRSTQGTTRAADGR
jgi:hypothetical protein